MAFMNIETALKLTDLACRQKERGIESGNTFTKKKVDNTVSLTLILLLLLDYDTFTAPKCLQKELCRIITHNLIIYIVISLKCLYSFVAIENEEKNVAENFDKLTISNGKCS